MTVAAIENVLTGVDADVVYVHATEDANAEHRAAAAATLSAARHSSRILHYAVESTLRFTPALFVDIDRKSTRLNSSHVEISYAVFCLKKKTTPKKLPTGYPNHTFRIIATFHSPFRNIR